MKDTKKSRPGEATPKRAIEPETNNHESPNSPFQCTTPRGENQTGIAALLMHGADHALPLRQLKQMTGLPGRDLRRRIEAARLAGVPILSGEHGYFLAENQHEVTQFVTSMNRRAKRIQTVAAAVERTAVE